MVDMTGLSNRDPTSLAEPGGLGYHILTDSFRGASELLGALTGNIERFPNLSVGAAFQS